MRRLALLALVVPALCLLPAGCGGSSVPEGVPQGVDMSKSYSPAAKPLTGSMSPDMAKKGQTNAASKPKSE